jgi:hypothetical protein
MRQQIVYFPLACLLLMLSALPCAWAQTGDGQTPNDGLAAEKILVARGAYTQHEDIACCSGDGQTLSEFAQRRPAPLVPPDIRYPRERGYGGMWRPRGNRRHALIGALVGFGVGAAIGAKGNQDPHARVVAPVLFAGAGALIGAAIGASHP